MIEKLIIWTPEPSDDYGAFSDCQNIEQPKPICDLCGEEVAEIEAVFNNPHRIENSCMKCYSSPDYQKIIFRKNAVRKLL